MSMLTPSHPLHMREQAAKTSNFVDFSLILIPWKSREKFVLLSLLFVNIFLLSRIISSFFIGR